MCAGSVAIPQNTTIRPTSPHPTPPSPVPNEQTLQLPNPFKPRRMLQPCPSFRAARPPAEPAAAAAAAAAPPAVAAGGGEAAAAAAVAATPGELCYSWDSRCRGWGRASTTATRIGGCGSRAAVGAGLGSVFVYVFVFVFCVAGLGLPLCLGVCRIMGGFAS